MSEIRQDPLLKHRVIFAPERATRPFEHVETPATHPLARCPFCRGNENETPTAVLELAVQGPPSTSNWDVRVIANRYAALSNQGTQQPSVQATPLRQAQAANGPYSQPGEGRHEVIVEAPLHETSMSRLSKDQFRLIARSYRSRFQTIRDEGLLDHVSLFKNSGGAAGASLGHVHSQLLATPFVANVIERELEAGQQTHRSTGRCAWCELLAFESATRERLVFANSDFVCWCPFASRYASEMCLMPRRHRASFDQLHDAELEAFADALRDSLQRLEQTIPGVAFNFAIHTAPFEQSDLPHFHWHLEIMPRVLGLAGFELGAGCHINTILPEVAAAALRSC